MGAAKTDDLFPALRNPEGTRIINERCLIRTQDEHRVVLVSGIVLAQYSLTDQMAEAYAMVNLVAQGWATQQEVARAFHCPRARCGGISGDSRTGTAQRNAQALLRLDHTIRSTALHLGDDDATATDLVLEARSLFTITNAIPCALGPAGQSLLGENGLPLTPEDWRHHRLSSDS